MEGQVSKLELRSVLGKLQPMGQYHLPLAHAVLSEPGRACVYMVSAAAVLVLQ